MTATTKKASRFDGTLIEDLGETPMHIEETLLATPQPVTAPPHASEQVAPEKTGGRGKGRPAIGKRNDAEWTMISAFVKGKTLQQVDIEMIRLGRKKELSNLIETLLTQWLENPQPFTKY
jgi:hypothetical protein